ncbi:transcriptional regulator GutM [Sporolactobacillus shoreicorticis]|uniref:Transcriptional regulator GutM n=1 Tax=Sporolactobacillus shoreicorticis TaxID=1923877 RepID=A0ABW5S369_9BACL|nr:transcriptional regulator GutM [Sporolactobacillus shoreicorticis]MCO7127241.1 transcriptional regulator GutM [Sporolactobacillus shoreicorticis]
MLFYILMFFIGGAFLLQLFFGYFQIKHFSNVFVEMRRKGKVAIGRKKGHFKSGTIVFFTVDPDGNIVDARKMQGVTIFARFHEMNEFIHENIQHLPEMKMKRCNKLLQKAIANSVHNYTVVANGGVIKDAPKTPMAGMSLMIKSLFQNARKSNNQG